MTDSVVTPKSREAILEDRKKSIAAIAARTGYPAGTIAWISGGLVFLGCYQRKGRDSPHASAADFCHMLIADLDLYSIPAIRERLIDLGIRSSVDIGNITYELVAEGMCQESEGDSKSDFDRIFDVENLDAYVAALRLRRDWRPFLKSSLIWTFYLAGVFVFVAIPDRHTPYITGACFAVGFLVSKVSFGRERRFGIDWSNLRHRHRSVNN